MSAPDAQLVAQLTGPLPGSDDSWHSALATVQALEQRLARAKWCHSEADSPDEAEAFEEVVALLLEWLAEWQVKLSKAARDMKAADDLSVRMRGDTVSVRRLLARRRGHSHERRPGEVRPPARRTSSSSSTTARGSPDEPPGHRPSLREGVVA